MKFAFYATVITAFLAVAGCTTDDGYDGCHGVGCMVDAPRKSARTIDTRPQFDREGNPNFDTQGRYQGCHGIGCEVDDPDDGDQTVDDRPQYDDEGNPNFNTDGEYQGCHGIGCEVDTPDDDTSDDGDSE